MKDQTHLFRNCIRQSNLGATNKKGSVSAAKHREKIKFRTLQDQEKNNSPLTPQETTNPKKVHDEIPKNNHFKL